MDAATVFGEDPAAQARAFAAGDIDVLVATTVVVPAAATVAVAAIIAPAATAVIVAPFLLILAVTETVSAADIDALVRALSEVVSK